MAKFTIDHLGDTSIRGVAELDERNRLVINLRRWPENDARMRGKPRHAYFHLWDLWILWERRKTPRHRWSNAATGWLGTTTLNMSAGTAGPLEQYEEEEAPRHVDSQGRLTRSSQSRSPSAE